MAWNPEVYDQFKEERSAPFFDLLKLVESRTEISVIDLGCGTGELTSKLLDYLEDSKVLGIDSSEEMLEKASQFKTSRLTFEKEVSRSSFIWEILTIWLFLMQPSSGAVTIKNFFQE